MEDDNICRQLSSLMSTMHFTARVGLLDVEGTKLGVIGSKEAWRQIRSLKFAVSTHGHLLAISDE